MAAYGDQFNFQTHQFADPTAGLQQALGTGGLFATTLSNMVSNDKDQIQLTRQSMEDQQRQQTFDNAQTKFQQEQKDRQDLENTNEAEAKFLRMSLHPDHTVPQDQIMSGFGNDKIDLATKNAINKGGGSTDNSYIPSDKVTIAYDSDGKPMRDANGKIMVTRTDLTDDDGKPLNNAPDLNSFETNYKGQRVGYDAISGTNSYTLYDDGKWHGTKNGVLVDNQNAVAPGLINDSTVRAENPTLDPTVPDNRFIVHKDGSVYQISSAINPDTGKPYAFDGSIPLNAENTAKVLKMEDYGNAYNTDAKPEQIKALQDTIAAPIQATIDSSKLNTSNYADLVKNANVLYKDGDYPSWLTKALLTQKASEAAADKENKSEVDKLYTEKAVAQQALSQALLGVDNKTAEMDERSISSKNGGTADPAAISAPNAKPEDSYDAHLANIRYKLLDQLGRNAPDGVRTKMLADFATNVAKGRDADDLGVMMMGNIKGTGKYVNNSKNKDGNDKASGDQIFTYVPIDPANVKMSTPEQLELQRGIGITKAGKVDHSKEYGDINATYQKNAAQALQPYYERIAKIDQQIADVDKSSKTTYSQELQNNVNKAFIDNNVSGYKELKAKNDADIVAAQNKLYGHPADTTTDKSSVLDMATKIIKDGEGGSNDPLHSYDDHFASTNAIRPVIGKGYLISALNDELKRNGVTTQIPNNSVGANTFLNALKTADPAQYQKILGVANDYQRDFIKQDIKAAYTHMQDLPDSPAARLLAASYASYVHQYGPGIHTQTLDNITASIKAHDFDRARYFVNHMDAGKYMPRKQDTINAINGYQNYIKTQESKPYQSQTPILQKSLDTATSDAKDAAGYVNDNTNFWDPLTNNADLSRRIINNSKDKEQLADLARIRLESSQQLDSENSIKQKISKLDPKSIEVPMLQKKLADMQSSYWSTISY